jgi:aminoglycoside 6'-N-acetyltransferase
MTTLQGALVRLRPANRADIVDLVRIRETPAVYERWRGGDDLVVAIEEDFDEPDIDAYIIELQARVVEWIQWAAEEEPDYPHAHIDL